MAAWDYCVEPKLGVALRHQVVNSSQHEAFQESKGVTEAMEA